LLFGFLFSVPREKRKGKGSVHVTGMVSPLLTFRVYVRFKEGERRRKKRRLAISHPTKRVDLIVWMNSLLLLSLKKRRERGERISALPFSPSLSRKRKKGGGKGENEGPS